MGNAVSQNVVTSTMDAMTNLNSAVAQQNMSNVENTITVDITKTSGNVVIAGNSFDQENKVNMNSVNSATSTQTADQELTQNISQVAYSSNKGVNLFQNSKADNFCTTYMSSTINVSNNVAQTCSTSESNNLDVDVSYTDKNVYVINNTDWQKNEANTNCMQKTLTNQSGINAMQNQISQSAIAQNVGLTMWALVVMLFLIVLLVIGGPLLLFYEAGNLIIWAPGILIAIAGIIFLLIYLFAEQKTCIWYSYSVGLKSPGGDEDCSNLYTPSGDSPIAEKSINDAQDHLLHNARTLAAVDYAYDFDEYGQKLQSGQATYYSYTGDEKEKDRPKECPTISRSFSNQGEATPIPPSLPLDNQPRWRKPYFNQGTRDLQNLKNNNIDGDIYLNVNTGQLFYKAIDGINVGSSRKGTKNPPDPGNYVWMNWQDATKVYKPNATDTGWLPPEGDYLQFTPENPGTIIPSAILSTNGGSFFYDNDGSKNRVYLYLDDDDPQWVSSRDKDGRIDKLKQGDLYLDVLPFLPTAACMTKSGCFLGWYWCGCEESSSSNDDNCKIDCDCNCDCSSSAASSTGVNRCPCCCTDDNNQSSTCPASGTGTGDQTFIQVESYSKFVLFQYTESYDVDMSEGKWNTCFHQTNPSNYDKNGVPIDKNNNNCQYFLGGKNPCSAFNQNPPCYKQIIAVIAGTGLIPETSSKLWTGFLYEQKNEQWLWAAIGCIVGGALIQLILLITIGFQKSTTSIPSILSSSNSSNTSTTDQQQRSQQQQSLKKEGSSAQQSPTS